MRFASKIIICLVVLQLLLMATGAWAVLWQTRNEFRDDFAKRTEAIADALSVSVQNVLCTGTRTGAVTELLGKVVKAGELSYALVRVDGDIVAQAGETAYAVKDFGNSATVAREFERNRVFTTYASLDACSANGQSGELEVGVDFRVLDFPLRKLLNTQILALCLELALGLLLATLAKKAVDRRIGGIEKVCDQIALGNFGVRAEGSGADEYATIGRAMNKMIESLEKLTKETARQRQELVIHSKLSSLGEMAGGVAHEINSPLAIISLRASQLGEGLRSHDCPREDLVEFVDNIQKTTQRIAGIIRGLGLFSRNAENDPKTNVAVRSVVEDSVNLCFERFRSSGIDLRVRLDEEGMIHCRATQISQVLVNLLNNSYDAVHTMPEKWVELAVEKSPSGLILIAITDSGPGIPADIREKLMQPFFTTKAVGKGTGLGLSISRGIAEEHGGRFYLDEGSPRTRFCLELPRPGKDG